MSNECHLASLPIQTDTEFDSIAAWNDSRFNIADNLSSSSVLALVLRQEILANSFILHVTKT